MPTVLITGAGRGLGFELARQYGADDWDVLATCRNVVAADVLGDLGANVTAHIADVTDEASITSLRREIGDRPIDLLINNAGVFGPREGGLVELVDGDWHAVTAVNVLGPLHVLRAFVDNLADSELKRHIAISSELGSISENLSGGWPIYRASKAALNAMMRSVAIELAPRGITTLLVHPGWVRTDMGGPTAPLATDEAIRNLRRLFDCITTDMNGRFVRYDGTEIGW